jgi:hypothetical protein
MCRGRQGYSPTCPGVGEGAIAACPPAVSAEPGPLSTRGSAPRSVLPRSATVTNALGTNALGTNALGE